jgi:uncharacterized surface protein with fasciclin (FAS1) repeats
MEVMRRAALAGGVSVALVSLTSRFACAQGAPQGMQNRSYEDGFAVMASDPRFTSWVNLLQQSGLAPYARGVSPYTVFAPTNAAINEYPQIREMLIPKGSEAFPDTSQLVTLVRSHVIYGLHPLEEFRGKKVSLQSVAGSPIEVDGTNPEAITVTWQSVQGQRGQGKLQGQPILAANADIYPMDAIMFKR